MAGATATKYANSGLIFLTNRTVTINNSARRNALKLKYEIGECATKDVAYIMMPVITGYSTALVLLEYGHLLSTIPLSPKSAGKSL